MCYLLAAITIMPRGMDGDRKQMKEENGLVSLLLTLSLSRRLSSLLCFLKVTWLWRDWQRHDSCGKQKVLHAHREMSMEWVFENNKSQFEEKSMLPWTSFELD